MKYIIALDQGTTSSRAIVFDHDGNIVACRQKEFTQYFPQPGQVEHNPEEIWNSESSVMREVVSSAGLSGEDIAAIGIANQRETTIVWEAATGRPIYNAIVWQDRRTSDACDRMKKEGLTEMVREKTGLIIDAYFSGTKVKWILDNVPGAWQKAERGELRFGTVDSWLVWNLTGGRRHVTDVTNASRTMLFNIKTMQWDDDLLEMMGVPLSMMPQVCSCSEVYGETSLLGAPVLIAGMAGDQQAAMLGQMCTKAGSVKNTYGTGCFLMMNTGTEPVISGHSLLTTIACRIGERTTYAMEGSIFVAGSVVQWLRDGLGIIRSSSEIEALASTVEDNGGVYFVPALTGLGAPYWNQYAKGTITGITRGTKAGHIARAALEGIAFQTMDIVSAMERDTGRPLVNLKVDGGASCNNLLMQFQADLLGTDVVRPVILETTALGAAYLAGLAVGYWSSLEELESQWQYDRIFTPSGPESTDAAKRGWADAMRRTLLGK